MPIAVVCDPHGNLCKEYVEGTTLIRSYRESPHTDVEQTIRFVCSHLLELLEHRRSCLLYTSFWYSSIKFLNQ